METIEQLLRKGEIDKEVYAISRLQEDDSAKAKEKLALHFDLTVPFARYVVENAGYLNFPFSRYQIQKVWRGERPQEAAPASSPRQILTWLATASCRSVTM